MSDGNVEMWKCEDVEIGALEVFLKYKKS